MASARDWPCVGLLRAFASSVDAYTSNIRRTVQKTLVKMPNDNPWHVLKTPEGEAEIQRLLGRFPHVSLRN